MYFVVVVWVWEINYKFCTQMLLMFGVYSLKTVLAGFVKNIPLQLIGM